MRSIYYENQKSLAWLVLRESFGLISMLLSFQKSPITCLKKTHLHKNYIGSMSGKSPNMLYKF